MSDSPTRARVVQTIAGLHTSGLSWEKDVTEQECADLAAADEKVETYWCEEGGGPPKGEVCKPTPAPVKTYSYNFETMQPTMSPTPQG